MAIGPDRFWIITIRDNRLKTSATADSLEASLIWLKRLKGRNEPCCLVDAGKHYETLASRLMEFLVIERGLSDEAAKEMMMDYMEGEMR